jgi:hypothetical protein
MKTPRRVTAAQVKELRRQLNQGASLRTAAMRANMDRKSARKYRKLGQLPSEARKPRTWRTWPDALAEVWPGVVEQLEREPRLQAKTLWDWLQRSQPGKYPHSLRRTFERRVRQWKGLHGAAKEVFFSQEHRPGRLAASDFTSMNDLQVTIAGVPFPHLLYHFVLTYSNWEHVTLCLSESFTSLCAGLQNALWALGAAPERHRTDRMTLAVHHDGQPEQFTAKYRALLAHYGMHAEATNPASGHENGDVESLHGHFKDAVEQALFLRGSREFSNREEYWPFLLGVLEQRNAGRSAKVAQEMACLRPLPAGRLETLERERVRVRRGSTIQVKHNTYSVPARLIGLEVEARIGLEEIEVWYAQELVQRLPRLRGQDKHWIDYRHIIDWLVRKPGAFARYVYREELYPTLTYRRAYDALVREQPGRADKEYVHLLHLAKQEGEARVAGALQQLLDEQQPLSEQAVRTLLGEATPLLAATQVEVTAVDLGIYDALLDARNEGGSDNNMSLISQDMEEKHEQGCHQGAGDVPPGATSAGSACPVRGSGPTGECRDLGVSGVSAGTLGAGVPAAQAQTDRTTAEGIASTPGEELGVARSETSACESGAAVAHALGRRVCRSPGERLGLWPSGIGENAQPVCRGSGTGPQRPTFPVHDDGAAGSGAAGRQTGFEVEGAIQAAGPLGSFDPRRLGLCAAESRGDGSVVYLVGGTLRAGDCLPDEQSAVLQVGTGFQGSHDDGGRSRSPGASQRHRGAECCQLPSGGRQTGQVQSELRKQASPAGEQAPWGPGSVPFAVAALRLPPRSQAPTAVRVAGSGHLGVLGAPLSGQAPKVPHNKLEVGKDNCRSRGKVSVADQLRIFIP